MKILRKNLSENQQGQTLLEILISFAIITIALVAVVSRATDSIRNANFSKNQVLAARYAQEGAEWARAQRDRMGWEDLEDLILNVDGSPVIYCVPDVTEYLTCRPSSCATITIASPCANNIGSTEFRREVQFTHDDPDADPTTENRIYIGVTVLWSDSIGTHQAQYTTILSDWHI